MKTNKHWALYGSGLSMESDFIRSLLKGDGPGPFEGLKGKRGVLFSSFTLNQFIKEEAIHDDYSLSKEQHRSIRTFSSGEQKKALLNYLLSKNPEFLVLDNVFDMLDQASQVELISRLETLSQSIPMIQIFRVRDQILPFIHTVLRFQDDEVWFRGTSEAYRVKFQVPRIFNDDDSIPPALHEFVDLPNPLIRFSNIYVKYGDRCILNCIDWEIKQGGFWQLIGPNGSGKTTLLSMITGDNPKAYGQDLTLFGQKKGSGESIWDIKKKIGYLTPAMTNLFRGRHTLENMVISGLYDSIGLYNKPSYSEKGLANQWLNLIGLHHEKDKFFSKIPEEKQCMVLIARSMIKHPPLLILDEPTRGLGDDHIPVVTNLINKIAKESQTTIIYVSHQKEAGLRPTETYELIPGEQGSTGHIKSHVNSNKGKT